MAGPRAVTISGNVWSYTYEKTTDMGDKIVFRDTFEFVTPEKRVTHIEISADGGQHWVLLVEETETKVS
jgi:hypothetical protein